MIRRLLAALAVLVAAAASAAPVQVPPLAFTSRTLANGLRVYAMPDKAGTTVSVQVWYDVGSRDDPRGRSGFAHLFEHLMFKATRDMPAEYMDRLTEDVGGSNNASTDSDFTEYHETAPANHLERLIWAEAQRMGSLVVDQASFASERDVVKEELRTNFAQPYGALFARDLIEASYRVHPYARPTIGSIADLDAATLADVRAFHATYYRPDNAVLIVAGNFDPATLDGWIDRYFGPIARPAWPIPRVTAAEPARGAPVRYTVTAANTPLPAVLLGWLAPPASDPDHAALTVIDTILSGGDSSRLYQSLVYRDRIAAQVSVVTDLRRGPGIMALFAVMAGTHAVAEGEAALRREVARLRDAPVTPAELDRARNQLVTAALKQRETAEGRASTLGGDLLVEGDPHASDAQLAAIQRLTPADVQRVARAVLAPEREVTIHYLPASGAPADPIAIAATVETRALTAPASAPVAVALAPEQRTKPPAPGPVVTPALPVPAERRLANGMRLVLLERHDLPLVSAALVAPRGAAADPASLPGLAGLAATLLTKGTATRSAPAIADAVESLGASIDSGASRDSSMVTLTARADTLPRALTVLADVALHPAFAQPELERARDQALDGLTVAYKTPGTLAGMVAARAVYGGGPYGAPTDGTPAALRAIDQAAVARAYAATWRPDTTTLVLAGDIDIAAAATLAERLFGGWRIPPTPPAPAPAAAPLPAPRTIVIDLPGTPQAAVLLARPTIARADPLFYRLLVANAALGGGYSSRLNQEVRIRRGLAYGASSSLRAGRLPGPLTAATQTRNDAVPQVIALIAGEMRRMATAPLGDDELAARKATLIGALGEQVETTDGLAGLAAGYVAQDVPLAEIGRYAPAVAAVTAAEVREASARLLDPAAASTVIVGDAGQFLPALKAKGVTAEVVEAGAIDLGAARLQ